jgi:hypothetical protein
LRVDASASTTASTTLATAAATARRGGVCAAAAATAAAEATKRATLDGDAALWIEAVARVCDTRIEQLPQPGSALTYETERTLLPARPQDVVAEAMVQELLMSLAAFRLAETETLVLDEVENMESLRWLGSRASLPW